MTADVGCKGQKALKTLVMLHSLPLKTMLYVVNKILNECKSNVAVIYHE